MNQREEMHDLMLKIMVETLRDIARGYSLRASDKMDNVNRWMRAMRSMMPEQMAQTMDDIVKTLEAQGKK